MRSITTVGFAILAALTLSTVTIASASAEEFEANKTGVKATGKALNTQTFTTGSGATVTCTKATPTGEVKELKFPRWLISISVSSCTISGLGAASVSLWDLTFSLIPFELSILNGASNPVVIKGTALGVECEIEIKNGQTLGKGLAKSGKKEVEYVNKTNGTTGKEVIEVKLELEKIESTILKSNNSTFCGTVGAKSTTGTYVGNLELEAEGAGNNIKVV